MYTKQDLEQLQERIQRNNHNAIQINSKIEHRQKELADKKAEFVAQMQKVLPQSNFSTYEEAAEVFPELKEVAMERYHKLIAKVEDQERLIKQYKETLGE
jgi:phage shock protein A